MPPPRLYHELAHLWPLLSPPDDYAPEAERIHKLFAHYLNPAPKGQRHSILELGGGGGHTLLHLADRYEVHAADRSESMLANCRDRDPRIQTHRGDMRIIRLDRRFDAVLAHDAIDYLTDLDDLRSTCATAAAHLKPGGLFLAGPTYVADHFPDHESVHDTRDSEDREVAYVSYVNRPMPGSTRYELAMTILVRENGRLRIEEDRHTCGLFPTRLWHDVLTEAGFDVVPLTLQAPSTQSREGEVDPLPWFLGIKRREA